ncbi:MAG: hypothetical protein ACI4J0_05015 [Huintestinicola sp.]|uniref:hypothetical protein n=1 Tax=Huintestinicola sp. TaxID=2981661 RepID=UPI003F0D8EC9
MTVGEALKSFGKGEFIDEFGFVLGIDMSENGDSAADGFTAVTEGVCGISADMSPRVVIRDFVDGDRAVPVSARAEIRLDFLLVSGDGVQAAVLSAAENGVPLRCVYMSGEGAVFLGNMLVSAAPCAPSDIYGTKVKAVFSAC